MYLPEHFQNHSLVELLDLIRNYPLATVIITQQAGLEVNHIPLLLDSTEGPIGVLYGHIAKDNPLFDLLEQPQEAYVIFHAEQHYISPSWYLSKQTDERVVPTWNYRVVHVQGTLCKITDEKLLRGILAKLTRTHEMKQNSKWKMTDAPSDYIQEQLEKIVAIKIHIESIVGKFKLSQNRTDADIYAVSQALQNVDPTMAQVMQRNLKK